MNDDERALPQCLSIAAVERDTGLSKDTLRVWERRYGFPRPKRDSAGDRAYPPEQVERLHVIRRLLDAGHRPGRIVALEPQALQALSAARPSTPCGPPDAPELGRYMDLIARHDIHPLRRALDQAALRLGLVRFVTTVVAPLNVAVGDEWMHGRFQVFEEHLYTECVTGVLRNAIGSIPPPLGAGAPRVVLTTFAQEAHGLGLLMAEALFALEGCACLSLGTRTPMGDIVQAAQAHNADIVALSFTAALSPHVVVAGLRDLRRQLASRTAIWVGGQCPVLYQRAMPGILAVRALESIAGQIAHWRREERDAALHAKGA